MRDNFINSKLSNNFSATHINLSNYNVNTSQYTCPNNGIISISGAVAPQQWSGVQLYVNDTIVWSINAGGYSTAFSSDGIVRVNKGDKVYYSLTNNAGVNRIVFIQTS